MEYIIMLRFANVSQSAILHYNEPFFLSSLRNSFSPWSMKRRVHWLHALAPQFANDEITYLHFIIFCLHFIIWCLSIYSCAVHLSKGVLFTMNGETSPVLLIHHFEAVISLQRWLDSSVSAGGRSMPYRCLLGGTRASHWSQWHRLVTILTTTNIKLLHNQC